MHARLVRILALVAAIGAVGFATEASAQARAKVGTLTCNLAPTVGLIVASKQHLSCRYTPDGPWPPEIYYGNFTTVGLDIGFKEGGRLI